MNKKEDFLIKVKRVRKLLEEKDLDAVTIQSQANFTWLTGARSFIGLASVDACASIIVDKESAIIVVNNIEYSRIAEEEVAPIKDEIEIKAFNWYEDNKKNEFVAEYLKNKKFSPDSALGGDFMKLRAELTGYEIEEYKWLGKTTAGIVEEACFQMKRGTTEFETAGFMSRELWSNGIEPITMLISFDERFKYKHPVPTENKFDKFGMLSVCTRKQGLIASATRHISAGNFSKQIDEIYNKVAGLEIFLMENSRPGTNIGSLFSSLTEQFKLTGYENEWQFHHQGGTTGYAARDVRADENIDFNIVNNQALAWNPSIKGIKLEETIIVNEGGYEVITNTGNFKYRKIDFNDKKVSIPDIYVI